MLNGRRLSLRNLPTTSDSRSAPERGASPVESIDSCARSYGEPSSLPGRGRLPPLSWMRLKVSPVSGLGGGGGVGFSSSLTRPSFRACWGQRRRGPAWTHRRLAARAAMTRLMPVEPPGSGCHSWCNSWLGWDEAIHNLDDEKHTDTDEQQPECPLEMGRRLLVLLVAGLDLVLLGL